MRRLRVLSSFVFALAVACGTRASTPDEPGGPAPADAQPAPPTPAPTSTAQPDGDAGVDAPDANAPVETALVHLVGRVDRRDPAAPKVGFPGSEIRVRVEGTAVSATLADRGVSHWSVVVDGAALPPLVVSGAARAYPIASGLSAGTHDVVLVKRTETSFGVTTFGGFEVTDGTVVPSPVPTGRRLEFVGDSITCGYGVLGADETCPFSADTESEPDAFAALAAEQVGALHTSVCWSGRGVVRNFAGDTTDTMPSLYGRALADDATSAWDAHAFEPDAVIVGLGTNDFAGGKGDPGEVFADTYAAFLADVRAAHPAAAIVLLTSPMLSTPGNHELHRAHLVHAMEMRAAAGDTNLSLLDVPELDVADGMGCGFHPSRITHQKMATQLAAHLNATLGW